MKSNKEKFLSLVSKENTNTVDKNRERIKNRARLRESQYIALKVLDKLDEKGWTQKKLAVAMNVSPQQISKIVSGKENLTLDTQIKIQTILDIPILASYYENIFDEVYESIKFNSSLKYEAPSESLSLSNKNIDRKSKKLVFKTSKVDYFEEYKLIA